MSGSSRRGSPPGRPEVRWRWLSQVRLDRGLAAFLILAMLLGGASRDNALRLAVLELAALPLLGGAAVRLWDQGAWGTHRLALSIAAAVVAVPALQLIPLPPGLWELLPGREQAVLALEVAELERGWTPYSLTPDMTMRSLLALLPPLAVFLAVLAVPQSSVTALPRLLLGTTAASLALGALQLGSRSEAFYLWDVTDAGSVVGFFANRNHLATMCLIALPFCALLMGRALQRGSEGRNSLGLWGLFGGTVFVALVAIQSRMGVILALPMLAASILVARRAAGWGVGGPRLLASLVTGLAAVAAVAWFISGPLLDRFYADEADMRAEGWPVAFEAAQTYLPGGAGMGAFDRVYRSVEPLEQVDETYFNRAHNDYLEAWLEAGWGAVVILVAFLAWYGRRLAELWRAPGGRERAAAAAAAAAILAVLAHSFVDYPLRTITLAVVFALCCALMERRAEPGRQRTR